MKALKSTFLVSMVFVLGLAACSPGTNPVSGAETVEQKVWALYGIYVVNQELAAKLYQDCNVPEQARKVLKVANDSTYPLSSRLVELALTVEDIRAQVKAGTTSEEQLNIALANLATYYFEVRPKLEGLRNEARRIKDERGSVPGAVGADGCDRGPISPDSSGPSSGVSRPSNHLYAGVAFNPDHG